MESTLLRTALAVIVVALAVGMTAGCGGEEPAGDVAAPDATTEPSITEADDFDTSQCAADLDGLLAATSDLDSRLGVGLNFEAYSERVGDVRVAYDDLNLTTIEPACALGPGIQLEKALNSFVRAYTVWNRCVSDTYCTNDSIMKKLQGHWAKATRQIESAEQQLAAG